MIIYNFQHFSFLELPPLHIASQVFENYYLNQLTKVFFNKFIFY
jgi:hypothetical protein